MDFFKFMFGFGIENSFDETFFTSPAVWICVGSIVLVLAILAVICLSNRKNTYNVMALAFAAVCIGSSFGLSYWAPIQMPQGGSVTIASMLPICLYAYIFGFKRGLLVGIIYSLLQIIQKPYIYNFTQTLLDYILAFSTISLSGLAPLLAKKIKNHGKVGAFFARFDFSISLVFVGLTRFIFHVLAGVIFFNTWAPAGQAPLVYSMAYNSFVFVDIAICIVPAVLLQLSSYFMNYVTQIRQRVTSRDKAMEKAETKENLTTI